MANTVNESTSGLIIQWDTSGTGGLDCHVETGNPAVTIWTLDDAAVQTLTGSIKRDGAHVLDQDSASGSALFQVERGTDIRFRVLTTANAVILAGGPGTTALVFRVQSTKSVIFRLDWYNGDPAATRQFKVLDTSDASAFALPEDGQAVWPRPGTGNNFATLDLTGVSNAVQFRVGADGYRGWVEVRRYQNDTGNLTMPGYFVLEDKNGTPWYVWLGTTVSGGSETGALRIGPTLPNSNDDKPTDSAKVCSQS